MKCSDTMDLLLLSWCNRASHLGKHVELWVLGMELLQPLVQHSAGLLCCLLAAAHHFRYVRGEVCGHGGAGAALLPAAVGQKKPNRHRMYSGVANATGLLGQTDQIHHRMDPQTMDSKPLTRVDTQTCVQLGNCNLLPAAVEQQKTLQRSLAIQIKTCM